MQLQQAGNSDLAAPVRHRSGSRARKPWPLRVVAEDSFASANVDTLALLHAATGQKSGWRWVSFPTAHGLHGSANGGGRSRTSIRAGTMLSSLLPIQFRSIGISAHRQSVRWTCRGSRSLGPPSVQSSVVGRRRRPSARGSLPVTLLVPPATARSRRAQQHSKLSACRNEACLPTAQTLARVFYHDTQGGNMAGFVWPAADGWASGLRCVLRHRASPLRQTSSCAERVAGAPSQPTSVPATASEKAGCESSSGLAPTGGGLRFGTMKEAILHKVVPTCDGAAWPDNAHAQRPLLSPHAGLPISALLAEMQSATVWECRLGCSCFSAAPGLGCVPCQIVTYPQNTHAFCMPRHIVRS